MIFAVLCYIFGDDRPGLELARTKDSKDHCSKKVDTRKHIENVLPATDVWLQSVKTQMKESDKFVIKFPSLKACKNKWLCAKMLYD